MSRTFTQRRRWVRPLVGTELVLSSLELVLVLGPLLGFFPSISHHPSLLGLVALLWVVWSIHLALALRPLIVATRARASERLDEAEARAICRRINTVPRRVMVSRIALWAAIGFATCLYLLSIGEFERDQIHIVLAVCVAHSFAVALLRLAAFMRVFRRALREAQLRTSWLAEQAETLFDRVTEVALVIGAASTACTALFVYLFVPMTQEQYLQMETYFPPTGTALAMIWYYIVAPRQTSPLITYLERAASDESPSQHDLARAIENAHKLPGDSALSKAGWFGIAALFLLVEAVWLFGFTLAQAVLVSSSVLLVAIGFSIYEFIWIQRLLRPVLGYLASRPGALKAPISALSLRAKMLLTFGGVVVFTVALALFWTYLQYGNMRADFAQTQARRELARVGEHLKAASISDGASARRSIARVRPLQGTKLALVPPTGPFSLPPLTPTDIETIQRRVQGNLTLKDGNVSGVYRRLDPPSIGSLVVLVPAEAPERITLSVGGVIWFFGIVLLLSLGLVLLTTDNLTRPLAKLEQQASEMAAGRLEGSVAQGGEYDEIGRLTARFEEMRVSLREKIATIEQLNVGLEETVARRTAELARRNAELSAAIDALKQAQSQLLTSEKLASIGQLVAGIAHEINNPINAVANTVEPLRDTVAELDSTSDSREREALEADLDEMLRVISSASERTRRIVAALRSFSRASSEDPVRVDVRAEIEEALALLQHRMRDVEVVRELENAGTMQAYRGQLGQALLNLMSNAADALEGQDEARLTVRASTGEESIEIEIADNGPGIPEAARGRIFDPFFTTKDIGRGTGLGLSITHGIVERHRGRIELETNDSGEHRGTTFRLLLPRELPSSDSGEEHKRALASAG